MTAFYSALITAGAAGAVIIVYFILVPESLTEAAP
jgi:hypothetical protein